MTVDTNIYDDNFFKNTILFEADSAKAAVLVIFDEFRPRSVVDIGCGAGIYLNEFKQLGCKILGVEGSEYALANSQVAGNILVHDLTKSFDFDVRSDICLCFEVAEHLPIDFADTLIATITKSSNVIVFTAAIPGQGPESIGHINEQPHQYWIDKFADNKYEYLSDITEKMRSKMIELGVVWWITNNLMIFKYEK